MASRSSQTDISVNKYPSIIKILLIGFVIGACILCIWWFFLRDKEYKCVNNKCIKVDDGSGNYANDKCSSFFGKDCSESSGPGPGGPNVRWVCSTSDPNICVVSPDGVGAVTKSDCERACRIANRGFYKCHDDDRCRILPSYADIESECGNGECHEADPNCGGKCPPPTNQVCEGVEIKGCGENEAGENDGSCDYLAYKITKRLEGSPTNTGCNELFGIDKHVINFNDPDDKRRFEVGNPFDGDIGEEWRMLGPMTPSILSGYLENEIVYIACSGNHCDEPDKDRYVCKDKKCIDKSLNDNDKSILFNTLLNCKDSTCNRNDMDNYFLNTSTTDCDVDKKSHNGDCFNNNICLPIKSNYDKYLDTTIFFSGENDEDSKKMCNDSLKNGNRGYIGGYVKRQVIHGMAGSNSDGRVMPFLNPVCGHSELNLKKLFINENGDDIVEGLFPVEEQTKLNSEKPKILNPDLKKTCVEPIVEILYKFAKENNEIIEHNYDLYMGYCSNDESNWRVNCGHDWSVDNGDKYLIENNAKNIFKGATNYQSEENIYQNILPYIPETEGIDYCGNTGDDIIEEDVNDPNTDPTWKYIEDHRSEKFECCGAQTGTTFPKKCCSTSRVNKGRQFCDKPEYFPDGSGERNNEEIDITDKEKYINLINGILTTGQYSRPSILVLPIKYEKYENDGNEGLKITNEWAQQYKNREVEVANMKIGSQYQCVPTDDINDSQYRYIISRTDGNLETDYNKGILDPLSRCEKSLDNDFGSGIASDELENYWGYFMGASGVPNNLIDIYNNTEDTEDTVDTDIPGIPNSLLVQPIDNEYCEFDICNCGVEWRTDDPSNPPSNKTCSSSCLINELNEWIPDNCSEYFSEDKECGIEGKSTLGVPDEIRFPEVGTANPYYCIPPNNKKAWFPSQLSDIKTDTDITGDNYCIGTEYLNDVEYKGSMPTAGSPQKGECVYRTITSNDLFRSSFQTNGKWIFDTQEECLSSWQCLTVPRQICTDETNVCANEPCGYELPYKVRNSEQGCCGGGRRGACRMCCDRYSSVGSVPCGETQGNPIICSPEQGFSIKNPPWPGSV